MSQENLSVPNTLKSRRLYEFGPFRLDPDSRLLMRDDRVVSLSPKAVETLLALVEDSGRLVEKEALLKKVWPDVIVEEGNLTQNISVLRKALGEGGDRQYIQTIPKRGYRFVAPVRYSGPIEAVATTAAETDVATRRSSRRWVLIALFATTALIAALWFSNKSGSRAHSVRAPSIAVLPFKNLSSDREHEYFADGMTDALIGGLANVRAVRVISRTSVMQYKDRTAAVKEIRNALKVDFIVEGSVLLSSSRVRITAQLIDAAADRHLWSQSYEGAVVDVLTLQAEAARAIAGEIRGTLSAEERARLDQARPVQPDALDAYLRARYFANMRTEEALRKGMALYQIAIDKDPNYALAWSGMGECYTLLLAYHFLPPRIGYPKARDAALRALALDEKVAEAHSVLGGYKLYYEWNWPEAQAQFVQALRSNLNDATAHQRYALGLMWMGRFSEALGEVKRAQECDPLSVVMQTNEAEILYYARHYDRAIELCRRIVERGTGTAHMRRILGEVYAVVGKYPESIAELEQSVSLGGGPYSRARLGHAYALSGRRTEAVQIIEELKHSGPTYPVSYDIALILAGLGKKDSAFEWLERAYEERSRGMVFMRSSPAMDSLRDDPRFRALTRRVGLGQ
jgi:TolB-like protein/DNA-binding winged helix-turn-helix (wHTH) protein/Tfp pilus assembly protein PilF